MTDRQTRKDAAPETATAPTSADDPGTTGTQAPPPIIKPGDRERPDDPPLPLVSPIVDGGNL
ncbi:hypothetical protein [Rhizobium sp. Root482]|jgi:hypothetical protein|uniref:hypothetical protein n=1 Tax=Rhizobium sp. Root482 TaxID=1736543 RepID=UPI0006F3BDF2|nr:hypothetical protein [Rhizobium sp. Root482]KQY19582.1 hypothetical protein ASD31_03945 [Rhizobium sp. Root482]